jgi:hypothetical protein
MTEQSLQRQTINELVDRFAERCLAQDRAWLYENVAEISKLYWQKDAVDKELQSRGRDARLALLRLYDHPNIQVRLVVATRTLAVAPVAARRVVEAVAASGQLPQAADARGLLRGLDQGTFKPT